MNPTEIYKILLGEFGPQDWWPVKNGFEPREWEIIVGAVLTQNTNWRNVEKALLNMKINGIITPGKILKTEDRKLETVIKPSGFYRQKAKRLKAIAKFVIDKNFSFTREELLKVRGIGPETADSILLYAFDKPYFVIDAYTRRTFSRLDLVKEKENYENIRKFFKDNLPKDINLYKEFHALIVELGKNFCRKEPECGGCPLKKMCKTSTPKG